MSIFLKLIFEVDENVLPFILKKLNVNVIYLQQALDKQLKVFPKFLVEILCFLVKLEKHLNEASIIAKKMNDEYVSIEHLIIGIFKSNSKIAQMLKDQGVTEKDLKSSY